jgi:HTH-type transcriptional regulator/antitoxin HigA
MKPLTKKIWRFASYADIPKTYRGLCQLHLPRPIHDEAEDAEASAIMYALAVFARLNVEQQEYLEVLTEFVDAFDKGRKISWPRVTGVDMLKHLMEAQDMNAAELSRLLGGSRNLGAMILRGERKLTLNHVRILARRFRVSADLFLE